MKFLMSAAVFSLFIAGCAGLLPKTHETARSPWMSFDDVKTAYDKIVPEKTTTQELKVLGFDPDVTPNVKILNYLDVAKAVQPIPVQQLDQGLSACLSARGDCRAYEFELKNINKNRDGNFFLDFFNFKRHTTESGWRFRTVIVIIRDVVSYKVWGGDPKIEARTEGNNPLGPLQDGNTLLGHIP